MLEVIAVERLLYSLNAKIPKNKKRIAQFCLSSNQAKKASFEGQEDFLLCSSHHKARKGR
jgi:hypothetical protein